MSFINTLPAYNTLVMTAYKGYNLLFLGKVTNLVLKILDQLLVFHLSAHPMPDVFCLWWTIVGSRTGQSRCHDLASLMPLRVVCIIPCVLVLRLSFESGGPCSTSIRLEKTTICYRRIIHCCTPMIVVARSLYWFPTTLLNTPPPVLLMVTLDAFGEPASPI